MKIKRLNEHDGGKWLALAFVLLVIVSFLLKAVIYYEAIK